MMTVLKCNPDRLRKWVYKKESVLCAETELIKMINFYLEQQSQIQNYKRRR